MSRVNVDLMALTDPRFDELAELLDLADADHARGKCLRMWAYITQRERVTLSGTLLQRLFETNLDVGGALLKCDLAKTEGLEFYIRGASERTTWLALKRASGRKHGAKGGRPAKGSRKGSRKGSPFKGEKGHETPPAPAPAPAPAPSPAQSSNSRQTPLGPDAERLAGRFVASVIQRYPACGAARDPEGARSSWALDLGKINRIDKRGWEQIERVLSWSQRDDFWQKNIRSGASLRKHFDALEARMAGDSSQVIPTDVDPSITLDKPARSRHE